MSQKKNQSMNLISEHCIWIWRIRAGIGLVFLSMLLGGLFVFFPLTAMALEALLLILYFLLIFLYIPGYYYSCVCYLKGASVIVNKGFFIHKYSQIHFSNIQYCLISQGFIQKRFKVCTVYLMMAGSRERIYEISLRNAYELKQKVEQAEMAQE